MAHHHLSLDCPACGGKQTAVGRVSQENVNAGKWHCFACRAEGSFGVDMAQTVEAESA